MNRGIGAQRRRVRSELLKVEGIVTQRCKVAETERLFVMSKFLADFAPLRDNLIDHRRIADIGGNYPG